MMTNWKNWEQIIPLAGRVGGSFISEIPMYRECIKEGKEGNSGYDVGYCTGGIASLLLDTRL